VNVCPVVSKTQPDHKAINMQEILPLKDIEKQNWEFFLSLPDIDPSKSKSQHRKRITVI
jgi:pyruvate-ferredoxin/flavodoxin oxidoreductase